MLQGDSETPLGSSDQASTKAKVVLRRNFEFQLPLSWLASRDIAAGDGGPSQAKLRLRFSLWRDRLPIDALPLEGWIELHLLRESDLAALAYTG